MSQPPSPRLTPETSQNNQRRAIAEVISTSYPPFDHRLAVVEPFDNESKRDVEFLESAYMQVPQNFIP